MNLVASDGASNTQHFQFWFQDDTTTRLVANNNCRSAPSVGTFFKTPDIWTERLIEVEIDSKAFPFWKSYRTVHIKVKWFLKIRVNKNSPPGGQNHNEHLNISLRNKSDFWPPLGIEPVDPACDGSVIVGGEQYRPLIGPVGKDTDVRPVAPLLNNWKRWACAIDRWPIVCVWLSWRRCYRTSHRITRQ